ncbi:ParB N-terminal domain-containing protein [Streptomyces cavourensis]
MAAKKPWADLLDGPGKPGSKRTTAVDDTKPDVPPTTVHMHTIIGNPENPRTEADYADDDEDFRELKESMKSVGQLQPAVVMSRTAFLAVKPEFADQVGDKQWVVVLGNRRFHAAKQLGWTKFEIRVRDRLGNEDDDKIDEAVVIENIHRKNIPPTRRRCSSSGCSSATDRRRRSPSASASPRCTSPTAWPSSTLTPSSETPSTPSSSR